MTLFPTLMPAKKPIHSCKITEKKKNTWLSKTDINKSVLLFVKDSKLANIIGAVFSCPRHHFHIPHFASLVFPSLLLKRVSEFLKGEKNSIKMHVNSSLRILVEQEEC